MNYKGVIIEESLSDKKVLEGLQILKTRHEKITPKHQTPWLTQWTLHTIEISEEQMDKVAEKLTKGIETEHPSWYIDFKNNDFHFIIFPNKVFKINVTKKELYKEAKSYGESIGIPSYQLQFERLKR